MPSEFKKPELSPGLFCTISFVLFSFAFSVSSSAQNFGVEWVRQMTGTSTDYCSDSYLHASGNFYHTGHFMGTVDFDPGAGVTNLTSAGSLDVYVQKMDANGNLLWAKRMGGTQGDQGGSIAVDASGNVYVASIFAGTADFDPGAGIFNLTALGLHDMYLLKLDVNGNFLWAKRYGNTGYSESCSAIALDAAGNIYSAGRFSNTVDFDPGAGTSNVTSAGSEDGYIQKLDANGNFVWVKQIGGLMTDEIYTMKIDASGNMYLGGSFQLTVDFDPGAGTTNQTAAGTYDAFILKLDASGNFLWAKQQGGSNRTAADRLMLDAAGNMYISYTFSGTADFDPGVSAYSLTFMGGYHDAAIVKLDANGNFIWARALAGSEEEAVSSMQLDNSGNVYATGYFYGTTDFDPGAATHNLTAVGTCDIFLQSWDANGNFNWVKQYGTASDDQGRTVMVDGSGKLYLAGHFTNTTDFEPATGNWILTSGGSSDIFFMKLRCQVGATDVQSACSSFTWIDGNTYTTSNTTATYSVPGGSAGGCDSIVTLNLTIGDNVNPVPDIAALPDVTSQCAVASLTDPTATDNCAGTLTATHNASLPVTTQGTTVITWTYDDGNGNTSTQTQNVIIADTTSPVPNIANLADVTSNCEVNALTSPVAMDNCIGSVTASHNASLPISTPGTTVVTWTYDDGHGNMMSQTQNVIIIPIDTAITINGMLLTAGQTGASYQWIDCGNGNTPVPGATGQSFTPTQSGSYAVEITLNNCVASSECVYITSIHGEEAYTNIARIYPNPACNLLQIVSEQAETIMITDVCGKIILQEQLQSGTNSIDVSVLAPGVYCIQTSAGVNGVKFVKE
jgi:hypothetical protein